MKISQLRMTLINLTKKSNPELVSQDERFRIESLLIALEPFDNLSVEQFCQDLIKLKDKQKKSASKSKSINRGCVEYYLNELGKAIGDRALFEEVIASLQADKLIRLAELNEIALGYVGGTTRYRKRANALKDIKLRFEAHMNAKARLQATEDIF